MVRAGWWVAGFLVPLAVLPFLISPFGLSKLLAVSVAVGLLGLGAVLGPPRDGPAPELTWPFGLALASLAASTMASSDRFLSVFGQYDHFAFGAWPMAMLLALAVLGGSASDAERERCLTWMLVASGIVGLYGLIQALGLDPFAGRGSGFSGRRPVSTIGGPVTLASYLSVMVPLALHRCLESRRLWPCLALALAGLGLLASGGRAGVAAAACGVLVYLPLSGKAPGSSSARRLLAAGFIALAGILAWRVGQRPWRAVLSGDVARVSVWRMAWDAFREHPWLGAGPDTFELEFRKLRGEGFLRQDRVTFPTHAHNDVLQVLATTGILGLAAYAAVLLGGLGLLRSRLRETASRARASAMAAGLAAAFVAAKFNPVSFETLVPAALLLGFLAPPPRPAQARPGLSWPLAAFGCASLILCLWVVRADMGVKWCFSVMRLRGPGLGLSSLVSAVGRRPCEIRYLAILTDVFNESLPGLPLERSRELLASAAGAAERAARCRPLHPAAHDIRGFLSLMQAKAGDPSSLDTAEASLDEALRLDPSGKNTVYRRMLAARMRGDKALEGELAERYERLHSIGR